MRHIYDKRDKFSYPIVNFLFLDGDVSLAPSYGVYNSQIVWFSHVCTKVLDLNNQNLHLTGKSYKDLI